MGKCKKARHPEALAGGKYNRNVILSDSEKSLTKNTCHPERSEGTTYVDTLPIHAKETSTTAEVSFANSSCPPLVGDRNLRFRGGQLFDMDSSVVPLPQNDCNVALDRDFSQTSFAQNDGSKSKESRHPEYSAGQNNPVNCFARGEEGSLTRIDRDSSQIAFAQNDCKKKKVAFTLAEGATHVDTPPTLAKAGFTLAEVLITLGIIGVVAAMTIPNLIANTKGQQYRTKFKKAISTLSQAGLMAQAKYDFDYAGVSAPCIDPATDNPEEIMSICALLNGTLTGHTYLGKAKELYPNGKVSSGGAVYGLFEYGVAYALADGSVLVVHEGNSYAYFQDCKESSWNDPSCFGFIDINGVSLPNKEVSCTKGNTSTFNGEDRVVTNNPNNLTDIYPIWFHDSTVEPLTNAAYYVLHGHTGTRKNIPL